MIVVTNTLSSINYVTGTWKTELGMLMASIYVLVVYGYEPIGENK